MLPEKSIACCSLTLKSTNIFVLNCFEQFSLINRAWSVHISILIQTKLLFRQRKQYCKGSRVKNFLMDLLLTNTQLFTSQDVNWCTWVMWIIVFVYHLFGLSFWRHPFTAEDPLVSKWYNAKFLQICSDEDTNYIYIQRWPGGELFF